VNFIVYGVKKNSKTPNTGNDSGAITLPNSSRIKAENGLLQNYKQQQDKKITSLSCTSNCTSAQLYHTKLTTKTQTTYNMKTLYHSTENVSTTAPERSCIFKLLFFNANTHYHHLLLPLQPNGSHHSHQIFNVNSIIILISCDRAS
jgi:hypothetical protein